MRRSNFLVGLTTLLLSASSLLADRGHPRIETVFPGAVTRGKTTEVWVTGRYNFRDAVRVLVEGEGVTATVMEWKDLADPQTPKEKRPQFDREAVKLKVQVLPEAAPGIREFRVITKGSLSGVAHLMVTDLEAVNEIEPNDSPEQAQRVVVPQVVNGWLDKERDFDVYRFDAKSGDRVSFVVHADRLQQRTTSTSDVALSLRDESGREISFADDSYRKDPQLFHTFSRDGVYYLFLSEASYGSGKDKWWYSLTVSTGPIVTSIYPLAAGAGGKVKFRPTGFNLEGLEDAEIEIPKSARDEWRFQLRSPKGLSNEIRLHLSDLPKKNEDELKTLAIQVPSGINGCVCRDREVDAFRFHAVKGQRLEFEISAHRYGSPLDALLEVRDASGRLLAVEDDSIITVGWDSDPAYPVEKDPRMEWTAPAEGDYEVIVRDANYFGSENHGYYLAVRPQEEDFRLVLDDDRMFLGPGESIGRKVLVQRRNGFSGPVQIVALSLPKGVTALDASIPAELDDANLVLTGAPDAKTDVREIQVVGTASLRKADGSVEQVQRVAQPYAVAETGYRILYKVHSAVVAVVEGSDIIVECSPKHVQLRRGESVTVDVTVKRDNFTGPILLNTIVWNAPTQRFGQLPRGIVVDVTQSKTSLGENENSGRITLRALPDALSLQGYLMVILGQITYNPSAMSRVAAPFRITVTD